MVVAQFTVCILQSACPLFFKGTLLKEAFSHFTHVRLNWKVLDGRGHQSIYQLKNINYSHDYHDSCGFGLTYMALDDKFCKNPLVKILI